MPLSELPLILFRIACFSIFYLNIGSKSLTQLGLTNTAVRKRITEPKFIVHWVHYSLAEESLWEGHKKVGKTLQAV
jgi:hypothetical protein